MSPERFYSPLTRRRLACGLLALSTIVGLASIAVRHWIGTGPGVTLLVHGPIILYCWAMLAYLWFERRYRRRSGG